MKLRKSKQREATRLGRVASRMPVESLGKELGRQAQSLYAATGMYVSGAAGQPLVALDVIKENADAVLLLVDELERRERGQEGYLPAPDPKVEKLHQQYLERERKAQEAEAAAQAGA